MNELQQKEFELLKCFIEICEKLGLTYYLVCGSALGAVKYKGFIPWDDDVDVALPREDYEIFCSKAGELLPKGFFLQTYKTDPEYPRVFAKIRNSNTAYFEKSVAKFKINHGVYIDVFPLDGYPTNRAVQRKIEIKKVFYDLLLSSNFESDCTLKVKILRKIFRFFGVHKRTAKIVARFEKMISSYPAKTSEIWCNHGNWQGKLEYSPKEHYGDGAVMEFEGIKVSVPQKYDEYLTQKYGDWRADLPEEQKVGHHFYSVMDLNKSYTEYIKQDGNIEL